VKNIRLVARVLTVLGAFAALLFFFFPFVNITLSQGQSVAITGAELCFGGSHTFALETGEITAKNAISLYFTFTILVSLLAVILAGAAFKNNTSAIAAPAFSLLSLIMFLSFLPGQIAQHVDFRPFSRVSEFEPHFESAAYATFFFASLFCMVAAVVFGVVTIFLNDAVAVEESGGERKHIFTRFARWLRDYKSEMQKIVWPGKQETIRNTLIVVAMCVVVGAIVWALDGGFGKLLDLFTGLKNS
jgi:preprotein translocase subunit SecE